MPWTFQQSTGRLELDGVLVGTGYAGGNVPPNHDPSAVNNPTRQAEHNTGPLPQGHYAVEAARNDPVLGAVAMPLTPDPANQMFGRSGFFIHADSFRHPGAASEGCIVLPLYARAQIATSPDRSLRVIP